MNPVSLYRGDYPSNEQFLRQQAYVNSVIQSEKEKFISSGTTERAIGSILLATGGLFAIRAVINLNNIKTAKLYLTL